MKLTIDKSAASMMAFRYGQLPPGFYPDATKDPAGFLKAIQTDPRKWATVYAPLNLRIGKMTHDEFVEYLRKCDDVVETVNPQGMSLFKLKTAAS